MNIFHRDRDRVKIVESWRENGRRERRDDWERREGWDRRQSDLRDNLSRRAVVTSSESGSKAGEKRAATSGSDSESCKSKKALKSLLTVLQEM